ncbi:hypothetical protein QEZ54_14390 [Catellatospora sp. KI3]|uniref:hypothetical protein n=1 Tax=Catellatospora sp. KI3 TaxID=3041620 RepID=UPI002482628E|nr:hypothetical protein [Catellatospora sp. KI3]MDI1462159.1 hypothetical protein [Catellatospora sp. KI3]
MENEAMEHEALQKEPVFFTGILGGAGIAVGLLCLIISVGEAAGDLQALGGILFIGGALMRIEAAIRYRKYV